MRVVNNPYHNILTINNVFYTLKQALELDFKIMRICGKFKGVVLKLHKKTFKLREIWIFDV